MIKIEIGDKVFRADGCSGNVIAVYDPPKNGEIAIVRYDTLKTNVYTDPITVEESEDNFKNYYLIGKNYFGNKKNISEIEEQIETIRTEAKALNAKLDQLRKQKWTLEERMVENWRENREKKHP